MSLDVNTKVYSLDSSGVNNVGYRGPAHSVSSKDILRLLRVEPKVVTTSSGVGRTSAKLTRTLVLTGAKEPVRDGAIEVGGSIPVGAAQADVYAMIADLGAWMVSAEGKAHIWSQIVNEP
jgi:hypothetical protein